MTMSPEEIANGLALRNELIKLRNATPEPSQLGVILTDTIQWIYRVTAVATLENKK